MLSEEGNKTSWDGVGKEQFLGTFHFSIVILATASRVRAQTHGEFLLINPIIVCEAALGLHPIGSISKVKGYASNLVVKHVHATGTQFIRWSLGKLFGTNGPVSSANNCKENTREEGDSTDLNL